LGETGAPLLNKSKLIMECALEDIYETPGFDNFILTIKNTFAEPSVLNEKDIIDYNKLKPVLFEMPTYEYLVTGDVIGKCMKLN
ncbi:MAG: flavin reductase family protein, partial [Synergistaceae bacterium]|nr:flavin reductase family protein [Synergistaceae bacterium]